MAVRRRSGPVLLAVLASMHLSIALAAPPARADEALARVDHLIYAVPRLEEGVDQLERRLGVRASPGGRHPGFGTHNALLALGPETYLEVIAPDPRQSSLEVAPLYGIDELAGPKLVGWAARGWELEQTVKAARSRGVMLGDVMTGRRDRPDGSVLVWHFTNPWIVLGDGLVPFFIDWSGAHHPALDAPRGLTLRALRLEHPDPERVQAMLDALELGLTVERGPEPRIVAVIDGPRGRIELQ